MLDDNDIDAEPPDEYVPDFPSHFADLPEQPQVPQEREAGRYGALRGMAFAVPFAIFLWAILGWLIYLFF